LRLVRDGTADEHEAARAGGADGSGDQDAVRPLTRSLIEAITAARTPLQAEQVLCDQFGRLDTQLPGEADAAERAHALVAMLTELID
jgi:hypothetical protein